MADALKLIGTGPRAADIPAQLRRLADRIESGEEPASCAFLVVVADPAMVPPELYGWDSIGGLYAAGVLGAAANRLANSDLRRRRP